MFSVSKKMLVLQSLSKWIHEALANMSNALRNGAPPQEVAEEMDKLLELQANYMPYLVDRCCFNMMNFYLMKRDMAIREVTRNKFLSESYKNELRASSFIKQNMFEVSEEKHHNEENRKQNAATEIRVNQILLADQRQQPSNSGQKKAWQYVDNSKGRRGRATFNRGRDTRRTIYNNNSYGNGGGNNAAATGYNNNSGGFRGNSRGNVASGTSYYGNSGGNNAAAAGYNTNNTGYSRNSNKSYRGNRGGSSQSVYQQGRSQASAYRTGNANQGV
jgi:hypothetical protein